MRQKNNLQAIKPESKGLNLFKPDWFKRSLTVWSGDVHLKMYELMIEVSPTVRKKLYEDKINQCNSILTKYGRGTTDKWLNEKMEEIKSEVIKTFDD